MPARRPDLTDLKHEWPRRGPATQSKRSEDVRTRARELRRGMSVPERILWSELRRARLGVRIRRQHPLGPFFADFYCHAARLVVEIDGECHRGRGEYDRERSDFLRSQGLEVIRFPASDVTRDRGAVVGAVQRTIRLRLAESAAHDANEAE